ncbi:MAG TPA: ABC transporter permease [bacterium]|nr:ABC transporter permease [bacterium]HMW32175.1 ABC transporter permease [bacterium]HMW35085.1 ABC transporter permease [bacterium]HMY34508.1 ABC transporter permease [bacterium]HMZ04338.1 ABC transporter permease [bacterium]
MLYSYIRTAFRNIYRHKSVSAINLIGLTTGMTACLLIALYVHDELSYESQHTKADRIYRLNCTYYLPKNAGTEAYATTGPGVATAIAKDYPEIASVVRIRKIDDFTLQKRNAIERFYETVMFADSTLFDVFSLPLIYGESKNALSSPLSMVISKSMALKYFGKENAIGESFIVNDTLSCRIAGIIDDPRKPSHLEFNMIVSMVSMPVMHINLESWWNFSYHTFVLLHPGTDVASFEEKMKNISRRYILSQEQNSGYSQEYNITNLRHIHLDSHLRSELSENGRRAYVYTFAAIGGLILLIASINFINLTTARVMTRAREVGVRKVVGAHRRHLVYQFFIESALMIIITSGLCIVTAELTLPWLNTVTGKKLFIDIFNDPIISIILFTLTSVVCIGAGLYPALILSSFAPLSIIKSFKSSSRGILLRKVLVITQFVISIGLIAGIVLVHRQIAFMRNAQLGFSKEQTMILALREPVGNPQLQMYQNEFGNIPGVQLVTASSRVPGKELGNNVVRLGWDDKAEWSDMRFLSADYEFLAAYDLRIMTGRWFERTRPSDENEAFVINESAVTRLGFVSAEDALGKPLRWQRKKGRVIGVLKDFHFMPMQHHIEPFIVVMANSHDANYLSLKLRSDNMPAMVEQIHSTYTRLMPGQSFEYSFLDESFDRLYHAEDRFNEIIFVFTGLAILVACLGLFGLVSFTTEQRTKEIGVRKILGATTAHIIALIAKDFLWLIMIAVILATPLAYYAFSTWLHNFPYRTDIVWWAFPVAGCIAMVLAAITMSVQSVKASSANPVDALKYE